MATDRKQLVDQHIIHEYDDALVRANLAGCYGDVAARFYRRLRQDIVGPRVLDVGCGFGLFTRVMRDAGLTVHAIDIDDASLAIARSTYGIECHNESVYQTSLAPGSVSTAVINDAICHLEIPPLFAELRRLGAQRVIVHDSNLDNPLLRAYRHAAGHEEHKDYYPESLAADVRKEGFTLAQLRYENFVCLPASGGLLRAPLPVIGRLPGLLFATDRVLAAALPWVRLARTLAFRYVAIFDRA